MENTPQPSRHMNKILLISILLIVLGGIVLIGSRVLSHPKPAPATPQTTSLQGTPVVESTVEAHIIITKDGFVPATLLIKKGTMVTWKNTDTATHRVASDPYPSHTDLPGLDSLNPMHQNDTYSFTFEKIGKFGYHDHLNPYKFHGTIIVE